MPSSRKPSPRTALAKVDAAEGVSYEKQCRVIEGVVAPGRQSGYGYEVHYFTFADWRLSGGPLVGRELTLIRRVPPARGGRSFDAKHFKAFPDYSIQRFSVLLSVDHQRAVVDKVLTADRRDQTLSRLSERLQEPLVVSTRRFGDLVLNRELGWFEGKAKWNRKEVKLHLERDEDGGIAGAIKAAESLWADQAAWKRKVDEFAVENLLGVINEDWLAEGERPLTAAGFKRRMKLQFIHVTGDGRFEFWDDGGMFGNHAIHISGTLKDGLTDVDVG